MGDPFSHLGLDNREKMLASRFFELARLSWERGIVRFTSFLDEREQSIAACAASAQKCAYRLWGGFEDADRAVCAFADCEESLDMCDWPIEPVCIRFKKEYKINHRDILGTLMSQQIRRETIGDILVGDGEAQVFVSPAVMPLVVSDVDRIGGVGVECKNELLPDLPKVRTEQRTGIAASMRLDCITAMLTQKSRSESLALVRAGRVSKGGQVITAPAQQVSAGDKISIRGFGKFRVIGCGEQTRSGRLHVAFEKYI